MDTHNAAADSLLFRKYILSGGARQRDSWAE